MGHGKETPRQKMISIMYLFLTCMLALNVSKDVLNAFNMINGKLQKTNETFVSKNESTYAKLEQQAQINPAKAGMINEEAVEIQKEAQSLVDTLQYFKELIICTADGLVLENLQKDKLGRSLIENPDHPEEMVLLENAVNSKDNKDIPAQLMVLEKRALPLKDKIVKFKETLLASKLSPALKKVISEGLDTDPRKVHGVKTPWENENFEHLPLIAAVTNMTQMQTNIRNIEGDAIKQLLDGISAADFKFNELDATCIPKSNYVMQGTPYQAEIFLAAFDTTAAPEVYIGKVDSVIKNGFKSYRIKGDSVKVEVNKSSGRAIYTRKDGSIGEKTYEGIIRIPKPGSTTEKIERYFKQSYIVAQPSLVVSPVKMNVFYIGVENPVAISVPGIPSSQLTASMSKGRIYRKGKDWVVKVSRAGKTSVRVSAKIDGKPKSMGSKEFRVKKVPDPVAIVAGQKGGLISASLLQAAKYVDARLENFDFDLRFNITGFTISTKTPDGYTIDKKASGRKITSEQKQLLRNIRRGQKIYFEEITAKGPDGTTRQLGTAMFKVK